MARRHAADASAPTFGPAQSNAAAADATPANVSDGRILLPATTVAVAWAEKHDMKAELLGVVPHVDDQAANEEHVTAGHSSNHGLDVSPHDRTWRSRDRREL